MENGNILKLFPNVIGGELKSVTLSLSPHIHQVADRCASALRISKRRWLELLIENTISEHGEDHEGTQDDTQNRVSKKRLGTNRVHSENAGYIATEFDSLRDHEGGE